ncbi:leucine-rich repeat domain-containing protein [Ruminococcus sp.]|uniref:leucine-rich repeat domain-containing protein n=1 Tax=Ruminococcus sp. TaxID=41978 RepID=UPI0025F1DF07|nr:leucine-rich repeat domain-containing protein [Ruminococcus sp.]
MLLLRKKPRKLDLSGKNLDVFPESVFRDKKITSLDLSNNRIKEIPANIGELAELRYLHLENNDISQLHNGILKAKSLRCLYLKGNPMKKLPDYIKENATFSIFTEKGVHRYYRKVEICGDNKNLQEDIRDEVRDIYSNETNFIETTSVPTVNDTDLTFPRHDTRHGKSINTCVLFVDIRDSVKKNKDHRIETLVRMYSSFVYGVLCISKEYYGHPRNIIGDRVMIVFDEENCCDNAIKCAGAIMYFCKNSMSKAIPNDTFECGIGIHYGKMNVIKVGIGRVSDENSDYKNLVWIGEPANLASRLTDMAGKDNIPSVVISKDVLKGLKDSSFARCFVTLDKRKFKNIDFNVLGCNLMIK